MFIQIKQKWIWFHKEYDDWNLDIIYYYANDITTASMGLSKPVEQSMLVYVKFELYTVTRAAAIRKRRNSCKWICIICYDILTLLEALLWRSFTIYSLHNVSCGDRQSF